MKGYEANGDESDRNVWECGYSFIWRMGYRTGGILLPVIFKKSPKSENGRLESRAGWKGLCRKGMTLLFVLIAVRLDLLMGTNYLRDAVCIVFIANEALSILENAGLMGMPIPEVLRQAIDILNGKAEKYTESRGER